MASNERIRKYLDAGSVLGQVTRGRAEEIVRELVNAGEIPRSQAQEWVDTMVERSKKTSENLLETVRREVHAQLSKIDSASIEEIANQVAVVLKKSAEAGRNATAGATQAAKGAKEQAEKTAGRARDAAESVVPNRKAKKSKGHKKDGHKDGHKKDKAEKAKGTDEAVSEDKTAPKKAS